MLRHVHVETTMFGSADDVEETQKDLCWFLEALTQRNADYLGRRPSTPRLYRSGVRYSAPAQFHGVCEEVRVLRGVLGKLADRPEAARVLERVQDVFGGEHFCDIGVIMELGSIDCFPLSQKIIVRSKSTGQYELLSLGELRFAYPAYEALSYNFASGKQEFKSIVGFVDKGTKSVSKAHLSNGTDLIATDSHKFWTIDGSQQCDPYPDSYRLGERTMGEYVRDYADRSNHGRSWWTGRSRILQAARIPAIEATRASSDEAYLAGIYAAEGFQTGSVTGIAQHKTAVRQKIEEALLGIGIGFSYDKGRGKTPGSGAQYRLLGGSRNPLIAKLRELGANSFEKRFPQSFLSANKETIRKMLDAHADGDGWRPRRDIEYRKASVEGIAAEYSTSSDALMEQIRLGLLVLGNPTYAYHQKDHQGEGKAPIWRIDEYNENASKLRGRPDLLERLGLPDLTYATVRSAEPYGEARVGCIEVEDNHNFFLADGTLAANCDGLACWRAAELRQSGVWARPYMTHRKRPDGGTTYHALVLWPPIPGVALDEKTGLPQVTSEDPSLLLGMGGEARAADRAEEIRKNAERCDVLKKLKGRTFGPHASAGAGSGGVVEELEAVLGLRQAQPRAARPDLDAMAAELDKLFGRAA